MVAFSPEREDPGNLTTPRRDIPKVLGGVDPHRHRRSPAALYGTVFHRTIPMSSPAAAEMTKLLENIYRSVNIALINEMKQLVHPPWASTFGRSSPPLPPSPSASSPSIPARALAATASPSTPSTSPGRLDSSASRPVSLRSLAKSTSRCPPMSSRKQKPRLQTRGKSLTAAKVLVLGVAYKRDVDDLRESPALTILDLLQRAGAHVAYNDPFFPTVTQGRHYNLHLTSTPLDDLAQYDCVLIVTDHTTYDYPAIVAQSRLVIDTRNATRGLTSSNIVRC